MNKSFYLVTGIVYYTDSEADSRYKELNALLTVDTVGLNLKDIGKAQQALQMNLFRQENNPTLTVSDVVITNISFLNTADPKVFFEGTKESE